MIYGLYNTSVSDCRRHFIPLSQRHDLLAAAQSAEEDSPSLGAK